MTMLELEKENKLQEADILHISKLVTHAIELKAFEKKGELVDSKGYILDSLSKMLEMMLTMDIDLSRKEKLDAIGLLSKLKANKEYMTLVKGSITDNQQAFSDLYTASGRMFKKSQSAFGND